MLNKKSLFLSMSGWVTAFLVASTVHAQEYIPGEWGFSSDHLPVSASVQIEGGEFSVASFNVLNEEYKEYLTYLSKEARGQRLDNSELVNMEKSKREQENLEVVQRGFNAGLGIIGLQECSSEFSQRLEKDLAKASDGKFALLRSTEDNEEDLGVIIYDTKQFKVLSKVTSPYFKTDGKKSNYIQTVKFVHSSSKAEFIFINTHIPFGLSQQFVTHLLNIKEQPTIALGDLNLGYKDKRSASSIELNLLNKLKDSSYMLVENLAEYSHVNTEPCLDLFDHIVVQHLDAKANPQMTDILREGASLENRSKK